MNQQGTTAAEADLGMVDLTFYYCLITRSQAANRGDTCPVLLPQWQMEQNILDTLHAQPGQALRALRPHALEHGNRHIGQACSFVIQMKVESMEIIASITRR